jgi:predicted nucleotidyltransferase
MQTTGELIRMLRKQKGLPLRKVAAFLDVDQAVLSKMERGYRNFNKEQIIKLAELFNYDKKELLVNYLSDKVLSEVGDDIIAKEALMVAEEKIEYKLFKKIDRATIIEKIRRIISGFSKVEKAWIYGSFSRRDDNPKSDIDIAVKTDDGFTYFDLADIKYSLEKSVKRKIDIGFIDSFKPGIYENLKPDLKIIYERNRKKKQAKTIAYSESNR